jgi:hypothetical protein
MRRRIGLLDAKAKLHPWMKVTGNRCIPGLGKDLGFIFARLHQAQIEFLIADFANNIVSDDIIVLKFNAGAPGHFHLSGLKLLIL